MESNKLAEIKKQNSLIEKYLALHFELNRKVDEFVGLEQLIISKGGLSDVSSDQINDNDYDSDGVCEAISSKMRNEQEAGADLVYLFSDQTYKDRLRTSAIQDIYNAVSGKGVNKVLDAFFEVIHTTRASVSFECVLDNTNGKKYFLNINFDNASHSRNMKNLRMYILTPDNKRHCLNKVVKREHFHYTDAANLAKYGLNYLNDSAKLELPAEIFSEIIGYRDAPCKYSVRFDNVEFESYLTLLPELAYQVVDNIDVYGNVGDESIYNRIIGELKNVDKEVLRSIENSVCDVYMAEKSDFYLGLVNNVNPGVLNRLEHHCKETGMTSSILEDLRKLRENSNQKSVELYIKKEDKILFNWALGMTLVYFAITLSGIFLCGITIKPIMLILCAIETILVFFTLREARNKLYKIDNKLFGDGPLFLWILFAAVSAILHVKTGGGYIGIVFGWRFPILVYLIVCFISFFLMYGVSHGLITSKLDKLFDKEFRNDINSLDEILRKKNTEIAKK